MPLAKEPFEIVFEGLEQKTDAKMLKAGKLTRAHNVEFDETGALNKRRGYIRYRFDTQGALGVEMETAACRTATYRGELLVFGMEWLWAVADRDQGIDGDSLVRRGRLHKGNTKMQLFMMSSGSDNTWS